MNSIPIFKKSYLETSKWSNRQKCWSFTDARSLTQVWGTGTYCRGKQPQSFSRVQVLPLVPELKQCLLGLLVQFRSHIHNPLQCSCLPKPLSPSLYVLPGKLWHLYLIKRRSLHVESKFQYTNSVICSSHFHPIQNYIRPSLVEDPWNILLHTLP